MPDSTQAAATYRGTVAISYKPFRGAKLLGEAEGHEMRLSRADGLTVNVHSDTDFVPAAFAAKVYGIYRAAMVAKGPQSTHTFTSSREENILKTWIKILDIQTKKLRDSSRVRKPPESRGLQCAKVSTSSWVMTSAILRAPMRLTSFVKWSQSRNTGMDPIRHRQVWSSQ